MFLYLSSFICKDTIFFSLCILLDGKKYDDDSKCQKSRVFYLIV